MSLFFPDDGYNSCDDGYDGCEGCEVTCGCPGIDSIDNTP